MISGTPLFCVLVSKKKLLDHHPGHEKNNFRVKCDECREKHHDDERRQGVFCDSKQAVADKTVDDK